MAEASTSPELRQAFESHLGEAKGHVTRLEQVFQALRKKPKGQTSDAMKGLIEEGEDMVSNTEQSPLRVAGLIAAANRVEHYEIAARFDAGICENAGRQRSGKFAGSDAGRRKEG